ncbi:YncE family protein [Paenibacillus sp. GCM10023250]|uniref:YncE family protein n=1 Tax=Paenibacillus sp. GCM10023250 TaxID=3252648 RepID=UPI00360CF767
MRELAINAAKNMLYLAGNDLIAVSTANTAQVASKIELGGYNFTGPILAQGEEVYYASRKFDASNLAVVRGMYSSFTEYHFDSILQVRDRVVVTNRHVYDKDTYRILADLPRESSLAALDAEHNVYTYSYNTISKQRIELPELSYGGHTAAANRLDLRSPITRWASDNDHLYAVSTENTLVTINKDMMTVDNESYIGSKPVAITMSDGSLYAANTGSSSIAIVNPSNPAIGEAAELSGRMPLEAVAYGDLIFFTSTDLSRNANTLSVYSRATQEVTEIKNGYFDINAVHLALAPDQSLLYASIGNSLYGIELQAPYKLHAVVDNFQYSTRTLMTDGDAIYAGTKKYDRSQGAPLLATFPDQVIYAKGSYAFTQYAVYDSDTSVKLFDLPFEAGLVDVGDDSAVYVVRGNQDPFNSDNSGMKQVYKFASVDALKSYMDSFTPGQAVFIDYNNQAGLVSGFVAFEPSANDAEVDHYTLYYMNDQMELGAELGQVGKDELEDGLYYYDIYGLYPQTDQTHIAIYAYIRVNDNSFRRSTNYSVARLWDMPTFLANQVAFNDTDPNGDTIGGVLSWHPADTESTGSGYEVYFAGEDGLVGDRIARADAKKSVYTVTIPSGTPIPDSALMLAVRYTDSNGEQAPFYTVVPILDQMTRTPDLDAIKVTNLAGTANDSITVSALQTERQYAGHDEGRAS